LLDRSIAHWHWFSNVTASASVEPISAALEVQLAAVTEERDEYKKLVRHLREENERLKRGLLGQKAERLPANDAQLSLMMIGLALGDQGAAALAPPPVEQIVAEHTRRKPVRKPLPEHLPRVQIEIVPPEVEREPEAFELIGTDARSVLERRPSATVVVEILYKKFVRKDRTRGAETEVFVADTLDLPIERGTAGPGMLADSIVRRWQDHQPLTRLEGIYARDGLELSKCDVVHLARAGRRAGTATRRRHVRRGDARAVVVHRCNRRPGAGQGTLPHWPLLGPRRT
jgi:transposase